MAVPDFQSFFLPMLKIASDGKERMTASIKCFLRESKSLAHASVLPIGSDGDYFAVRSPGVLPSSRASRGAWSRCQCR